jgi:hypothetical protein
MYVLYRIHISLEPRCPQRRKAVTRGGCQPRKFINQQYPKIRLRPRLKLHLKSEPLRKARKMCWHLSSSFADLVSNFALTQMDTERALTIHLMVVFIGLAMYKSRNTKHYLRKVKSKDNFWRPGDIMRNMCFIARGRRIYLLIRQQLSGR